MGKKKHTPKHRKNRESIRRKYCPICDAFWPIGECSPKFGAHIQGYSLPFMVEACVASYGAMLLRFTWPYKPHTVYVQPTFKDVCDLGESFGVPLMNYQKKVIDVTRQQFAFPINYCPICGRKFKNSRSKLWR